MGIGADKLGFVRVGDLRGLEFAGRAGFWRGAGLAVDKVCVPFGGGTEGALEVVLIVDGDEAKARPEAFVPFEVIKSGPVHVAEDGDAASDGAAHAGDGFADPPNAVFVGFVGETVFGDDNGELVAPVEAVHGELDVGGVHIPAEVVDAARLSGLDESGIEAV